MPAIRTDGASAAPGDGGSPWESVYAEGRSFGDSIPGDTASPGDQAPQAAADGLSAGAGDGSPADSIAPQATPTGDDGVPTPPELAPANPADPSLPPPETDPLAGAEPFTFTVDGQAETIEGAYRLPGDGLYVPEDKVPQFQLMASQARTLDRQVRELHDRNQTWERLTSHSFRNADNQEVTLTGRQGLEAMRVEAAADRAAFHTLLAAVSPKQFSQLVDLVYVDGAGNAVPEGDPSAVRVVPIRNEATWNQIARESVQSVREKRFETSQQFASLAAPPPPPEPSMSDMALPTVKSLIERERIAGLSPADEAYLASHVGRFVRPTTPQERAATGSPRIVDEAFTQFTKDRASLRAEMVKAQTASAKTDAFNTGMNKGRQAAAAPVRPAPVAPPQPTGRLAPKARTEPSANDIWSTLVGEAQSVSL